MKRVPQLGYTFVNEALLHQALTHSSIVNEDGAHADNERMEFLGDAFTELIVSRMLYETHPDAPEGELSKMRAHLVSADGLALRARALKLGETLKLGAGERRSGGHDKSSLLANAFEAVVAAIYLDGGYEAARAFVEREFAADVPRAATLGRDPKTELQEYCQQALRQLPRYVVVHVDGPEHEREFTCEVWVGEERLGDGRGRSKKLAERAAALAALANKNGEKK